MTNTRYYLCVDYIIKIGNINGRKNTHDNNKKVITQWLYGISRDQIAKANQIGAGTVSAIIKQCKEQKQQEYAAEDGSEFDLIRQVAVVLKREGLDVNSFASSIRLKKIRAEGVE